MSLIAGLSLQLKRSIAKEYFYRTNVAGQGQSESDKMFISTGLEPSKTSLIIYSYFNNDVFRFDEVFNTNDDFPIKLILLYHLKLH